MFRGILHKLIITADEKGKAIYTLPLEDAQVSLNSLVGESLSLRFLGTISCTCCGREIRKTYDGGYCYVCFRRIPEADFCSFKPETCHFQLGTCRDPEWGRRNCLITHTVYLANSSGLKVGITRSHTEETRWLDQGAVQALPIVRVTERRHAGIVETLLKRFVNDKTNWRLLVSKDAQPIDLIQERDDLLKSLPERVPIEVVDESVRSFSYPVERYPEKTSTFDFNKDPVIHDRLIGIKGQYLLFERGVINVRKFGGYHVSLHAG
ncbi:MAG: DUF2797 domain-containing protein [Deltaproteobacteria bacterium]|nr:DUF2797 domain-containing protein [Deltaproteobacteria bacterium]